MIDQFLFLQIDHMEYASPFLLGKVTQEGYAGANAAVIMMALGQCFFMVGQFHVRTQDGHLV